MINTTVMNVKEIISSEHQLQILRLEDDSRAYSFPGFSGIVEVGETVIVNTTAVDLGLGTGGYHFIIAKLNSKPTRESSPGHIMKLRYTPLQLKTYTLEEQLGESLDAVEMKGHVVIPIELHSMLAPLVLAIKKLNPSLKIGYVMTDGAALPAFHSETIKKLKNNNLIEGTITAGHSFGGDYECVNFITGIQGSIKLLNSHITIIGMGPGIVGTGTKFGFSGVEQGFIAETANNLGCLVYPALRIGFADKRARHRGISHHSITNFTDLVTSSFTLVLPHMERQQLQLVMGQLKNMKLNKKHRIIISSGVDISEDAEKYGLKLSTMGRGLKEIPEFFNCLTALASHICNKEFS